MILPLMKLIKVDPSHLFAIPLLFDADGNYMGFDTTSDVTKMNGKGMIASK